MPIRILDNKMRRISNELEFQGSYG